MTAIIGISGIKSPTVMTELTKAHITNRIINGKNNIKQPILI